jgi:glycine/D-amino acid oxidase-like deaminating enzyme
MTEDSDPYLLTTFLLGAAKSKGTEFLQAGATKLSIENNHVSQVHVVGADGTTFFISCDSVVLAAGPWTDPLSKSLLPDHHIPISSYAGHSLIIRPSTPVTADCLFMTLTTRKSSYHPEIFPRASGEIYICGVNDNLPLPATPTAANPRAKDIAKVKEIADAIFPAAYIIEKEQLCFRPMTAHGDPFVCRVPHVEGVFVGAGHNFWGITLGPGTGKVLSEMVLGVEMSADVDELCL